MKTKKISAVVSIVFILLAISGIFAESSPISSDSEEFILENMDQEIKNKTITSIKKVDFEDVPQQINIGNIDKTHLSMYEIENEETKPFFMITFSEKYIPKTSQKYYAKSILNFGFAGELNNSKYLQTATGIKTGHNQGYVMMGSGSITGISTLLKVSNEKISGKAEIIIYKNGKAIGFRNILSASSSGIKKDYDLQSKDIVTFNRGDVISVYAKLTESVALEDIITNIEITTN